MFFLILFFIFYIFDKGVWIVMNNIMEDLKVYSIEEVLVKYDLTLNELFKICFSKKKDGNVVNVYDKKYIQRQGNLYRIRKSVNGNLVYFGYYDCLEDAIKVRDCLIDVGWKRYKLKSVCDVCGVVPVKF
jgi:hypothetical protein